MQKQAAQTLSIMALLRSRQVHIEFRHLLSVLAVTALGACGGDTAGPTKQALDGVLGFWHLAVNHTAITMSTVAPYDTLQLIATPQNDAGVPLVSATLDNVQTTYQLQDPSDTSITISSTGLIHARYPATGHYIIVSSQLQGITHSDTLVFNVTTVAHPPAVTRLALHLSPRDNIALGDIGPNGPVTLNASVLDAHGDPVSDVAFFYQSADPTTLTADQSGNLQSAMYASAIGKVPVRVLATVYGKRLVDSAMVIVTYPTYQGIGVQFRTPKNSLTSVGYFDPGIITVSVGAVVYWIYYGDDTTDSKMDVVFDNPAAAQRDTTAYDAGLSDGMSGNIGLFPPRILRTLLLT